MDMDATIPRLRFRNLELATAAIESSKDGAGAYLDFLLLVAVKNELRHLARFGRTDALCEFCEAVTDATDALCEQKLKLYRTAGEDVGGEVSPA